MNDGAKFIEAVENNNIDLVLQMIDAVRNDPEELYKLLEARKTTNSLRTTPLIIAVKEKYTEIIKILLDAGRTFTLTEQHVNTTTNSGNSPLYFAVKNKDIPTIQLLIEYGADVNKKNINGYSILDLKCIKNKNKEIIDLLIDAGAQMKPLRIFYDVVEENHLQVSPRN